jgi:hypothetical protein
MSIRRLQVVASLIVVLGSVGLATPRSLAAAPRICGPVCVQICLDGPTECEPCVYTGICFQDENCTPTNPNYYQADCAPPF